MASETLSPSFLPQALQWSSSASGVCLFVCFVLFFFWFVFGKQGTCNPDRLTPCNLSSSVPRLQVGMGFLLRFLPTPEAESTHFSGYQDVTDTAGKRNVRNKAFQEQGLG